MAVYMAPEINGGTLCRARRKHDWYDITKKVSWCRCCGILRTL